jgi:hypothetical protein
MSDSPQPSAVIHIAGVEQANALLESLRRQGFSGDVTEADGHWQVVVHSPREDSSRLLVDLYDAIDRSLPDDARRPEIEDL